MTRIKVKGRDHSRRMILMDIEVGTAFEGTIGVREGLFLSTCFGIAMLNDPMVVWERDCTATVHRYTEVDLDITVLPLGTLDMEEC